MCGWADAHIALTEKYEPPKKLKPLFKDKKLFKKDSDSSAASNTNDKAKKLLKELVDIEIDG